MFSNAYAFNQTLSSWGKFQNGQDFISNTPTIITWDNSRTWSLEEYLNGWTAVQPSQAQVDARYNSQWNSYNFNKCVGATTVIAGC